MQRKQTLFGIVIAGGRSLRFDGEKAVAPFAGRPLLRWAVDRLASACETVAVNARRGTGAEALARESGLPVIHDAPEDPAGPLSGIRAGLAWAAARGARSLAVSPCDAPLLPDDLFTRLAAAAGEEGAALAVSADGPQPLCSIWPVTALPVVAAALAAGQHPPIWRILDSVGARPLAVLDEDAFANLNTRAELQAIETRFTSGGNRR